MNKKGFTLIELLVVIAIIGLLSTLAVVALSSAREKARDSKRLSDLKQIQTALELYYTDKGAYPTTAAGVASISLGVLNTTDCLDATTGFTSKATCTTPYMGLVPADPQDANADYVYISPSTGNGLTYTINASLEGTVGNLIKTIQASPSGIQDVTP